MPLDALILLLLFVSPALVVGGKAKIATRADHNATSARKLVSPWIKRVTDPRGPGCWNRPWVCNQGDYGPPPRVRRLCCMNRCTEVTSDVNNCGLCGVRCPFSWQCCRGICINTNLNPFHCGRCEHRCPFRAFCFYGLCGYAAPVPPFPFPPRPPKPPFPPRPPKPPFPPKPPRPQPPPRPPKPPHGPWSPPASQA